MKHFVSKTILLCLLIICVIFSAFPAFAASDSSVEIIFEDVTVSEGSSKGEAKVKVSVKGLSGDVSISQIHFTNEGALKFAGIDYSESIKNNENSFLPQPTIKENEIICGIINANAPMSFNGKETELFTLSFIGEAGATTSLDIDKAQSYFLIADEEISISGVSGDTDLTASSSGNALKTAKIKLIFDDEKGFTATQQNGINIILTDEHEDAKGYKIPIVLDDDKHRDYTTPAPVYEVTASVVENHTYTVEISGVGFLTYSKSGISFDESLEIKPDDFKAGDINGDGIINNDDKTLCQQYITDNTYSVAADFNRDQKVDNSDLSVFENIEEDDTSSDNNEDSDDTSTDNSDSSTDNNSGNNSSGNTSGSGGNSSGNGGGSSGGGGSGGGSFGGGVSMGGGGAIYPSTTPGSSQSVAGEFADLAGYEWASESIYALKNKGIISGTSSSTYSPSNNIKRGDFILILVRMLGIDGEASDNFADVPVGSYYYDAIAKARKAGIATGDGTNFNPEATITRQDLITLAYRAFLAKGYIAEAADYSSLNEFADKASISEYALGAMASMVNSGIIKGSDGNVNPLGNATRAEVAVMCKRLVDLM